MNKLEVAVIIFGLLSTIFLVVPEIINVVFDLIKTEGILKGLGIITAMTTIFLSFFKLIFFN